MKYYTLTFTQEDYDLIVTIILDMMSGQKKKLDECFTILAADQQTNLADELQRITNISSDLSVISKALKDIERTNVSNSSAHVTVTVADNLVDFLELTLLQEISKQTDLIGKGNYQLRKMVQMKQTVEGTTVDDTMEEMLVDSARMMTVTRILRQIQTAATAQNQFMEKQILN